MILKLKEDLLESRKLKTEVKTSVLRVLLGEIELVQSRTGVGPTDESIYPIIRKMITSNKEVMNHLDLDGTPYLKDDWFKKDILEEENSILQAYLPRELNSQEIRQYLTDGMVNEIQSAQEKEVPKLIGVLVKTFKTLGYHVNGADIKTVIADVRSEVDV